MRRPFVIIRTLLGLIVGIWVGAFILPAPIHAQSPPDNAPWSDRFAQPGLGMARTVLAAGNGKVYSASSSEFALPNANGSYDEYLLAVWNGTGWQVEGEGSILTGDRINALAIVGTDVYVGGDFTLITPGGQQIDHLARWDGQQWYPVGQGVNAPVHALASSGSGDLYVGGDFTSAGGLAANRIARWDGSSWLLLEDQGGLANGTNARVSAIVVGNSAVYAGGKFTVAGGTNANYIAKWNWTTPAWSALGSGVQTWVEAVAVGAGGTVYAGGLFQTAGGNPANFIAEWDGTSWSAMGSGSSTNVSAITAAPNGEVYAGGDFSTDAGADANRIAKWDGTQWVALGNGEMNVSATVLDIAPLSTDIFIAIGGTTDPFASGLQAAGVARWDGTAWSGLGHGVGKSDHSILAFTQIENDLFAGGFFASAGDKLMANVARWDGTGWFPLGDGIGPVGSTEVRALATDGTNLYAGGDFSDAGSANVNNVAMWNGSTWSALGSGLGPGRVEALEHLGGLLYATGSFSTAGGTTVNGIAAWNGASWSSVGGGLVGTGFALETMGGDLYVGGGFTVTPAAHLARWDGSTWSDVGGGLNGPVHALATDGTVLYAGGQFQTAGGVSANNIAKWDGTNWSPLGVGVNGRVQAIYVLGNEVYVGGEFTEAGGQTAFGIARWNGSAWVPLGIGVRPSRFSATNGTVYDILGTLDGLFAGGMFTYAGDKYSQNIALWNSFVLPVEFTSFKATADGDDVLLTWTTASETNNAGFEIQKGMNGRDGGWETLAFVEGTGTTSTPQHYRYRVESVAVGTHVFRLKQIDVDGVFEYSPEVEVSIELVDRYALSSAHPNPFRNQAELALMVARSQRVTADLYDALGRRVARLFAGPMAANTPHTLRVDGSRLPSGWYLIRVQGEDFTATRRVALVK